VKIANSEHGTPLSHRNEKPWLLLEVCNLPVEGVVYLYHLGCHDGIQGFRVIVVQFQTGSFCWIRFVAVG
jgi:hypothetical protein